MKAISFLSSVLLFIVASVTVAEESSNNNSSKTVFQLMDVFELEYASDPRISADAKSIVYVRNSMNINTDRKVSNLWMVSADGRTHRPLTDGPGNVSSPRWSPDGGRLVYAVTRRGETQLFMRWMDTGQSARISNLPGRPADVVWSPDGSTLAFTMNVAVSAKPIAQMPAKPKGASWAPPVKVIDTLVYRADGDGFLEHDYSQVFVIPADGGTPRQVTEGSYDHRGPVWLPDGKHLIVWGNRKPDWEYDPLNTELYEVSLADGSVVALTDRSGPDRSPTVSPDGNWLAYLGFDDRLQGYQVTQLYLMNRESGDIRVLTKSLDRSVRQPVFSSDSRGIYFLYDDNGVTHVAYVDRAGKLQTLSDNVGGTTLGRPYASGSFTVASNGPVAFTHTGPDHPADIVLRDRRGRVTRLTHLNDDLLKRKTLGAVEEIHFESSHDKRTMQAWLVTPPNFDPGNRYPLILEIHGGPFANYGPRFSAEVQLYAAAGYVVLYVNPRGSTSYGGEFGNLSHHNYPGEDYDDLISGVELVAARSYVDEDALFVTGGSGGGVLTSWIVGKTDRFRAAVVAKPVINWTSFVLTADLYNFFYKYWFPGFPWDHPDQYFARSPLSLVGNVTTPTMLLTGEADYRTPMSETEQYYQALKLRRVDTALVRVPGAGHGIAKRPSNLIAKVVYILAWFERYREDVSK